jgi:membrane protein DedA with SNARE-associated domain
MTLLGLIKLHRVVELMDIGLAGYFVLFGLLFSCGIGMPLPEDIPLLVAGMQVGAGKMSLPWVAVAAWCGIIGGDCVLYAMSRRYGMNITRVPVIGKHVTKARIEQAQRLFERYGVWVVAVGRLFAGIRGGMVIAAGTIRFNFVKFLIADGLAALVSGGLFVWLGMKFGEHLSEIERQVHRYSEWISLALGLALGLGIAYYVWRKSGHAKPSEIVVDTVEKVAEHGLHLHKKPAAPDAPAGTPQTAETQPK